MRYLVQGLLFLGGFGQLKAQQVLKAKVSISDTIDRAKDRDFGVGDDGIYNIAEPIIGASSSYRELKHHYHAKLLGDYNLGTPWIEGVPENGVGETFDFIFDLSIYPDTAKAFSINSFFVINGFRKDEKTWKEYGRVKTMLMTINDSAFARIELADTYHFQWLDFKEVWLQYGKKYKIRFRIEEVYPGRNNNTAISEIQFSGRYSDY